MNAYSRFIFRLFPPKNIAHAEKIKHRLAVVYTFICWHALFLGFYAAYTKNFSGTHAENVSKMVKHSQASNIYEYQVRGFRITDETYTNVADLEKQREEDQLKQGIEK